MVKFPCGSLSPARRLAPTYLPPVSPAWPRRTALSFASPARKQTSCWGRTVVAKRWTVFAPQQSSHNLNIWCRRFLPGNPRRASPCDRGPLTGSLCLQCCHFWTGRGSVAGHWPRSISLRGATEGSAFSTLGPVYYAARPGDSPQETDALVLCMRRKKHAQLPARPYLKLVS